MEEQDKPSHGADRPKPEGDPRADLESRTPMVGVVKGLILPCFPFQGSHRSEGSLTEGGEKTPTCCEGEADAQGTPRPGSPHPRGRGYKLKFLLECIFWSEKKRDLKRGVGGVLELKSPVPRRKL